MNNALLIQALLGQEEKPPQDWGGRLMQQFPYNPYFGKDFRDNLFKAPSAPGTDTLGFDKNAIRPEDWMMLRGPVPAPKLR